MRLRLFGYSWLAMSVLFSLASWTTTQGNVWEPLNGPPGAGTCLLAQNTTGEHTLFAATYRGVYISRDKGVSWEPITVLEDRSIEAMAATETRLFVRTEDGRVHMYEEGSGLTELLPGLWDQIRITNGILAVAQSTDKQADLRLLLADTNADEMVWEDISPSGEVLQDLQISADGAPIGMTDVLVDGQTVFASIQSHGTGPGTDVDGGLYVTRNRGTTWQRVTIGAPAGLMVNRIVGDTLHLLVLLNDPVSDTFHPLSDMLWESRDGGRNWQRVTPLTTEVGGLTDIHRIGTVTYLVSPSSHYIIKLDGHGHELIETPGIPGFAGVQFHLDKILFDPEDPAIVYGQTGRDWALGLVRSTDGMATWHKMDGDITASSPTIVVAHPEDPATIFTTSNVIQESYLTRDGGATWEPFSPTYSDDEVRIDPHDADHLLVINEMTALWESSDNGRSFSPLNPAFTSAKVFDFEVAAGQTRHIYASNLGTGISQLALDPEWSYMSYSPDYAYAVEIDPEDPSVLYAANSPKRFEHHAAISKYSADQAENGGWSELVRVENAKGITALEIDDRNPDVVYAGVVGERGRLLVSEDRGDTWRDLNPSFTLVTIHALTTDPRDDAVVYAATWGGGLFVSPDHGATWSELPCPTPSVSAIVADGQRLLVADRTQPAIYESQDRGRTWETIVRLDDAHFYRMFAMTVHQGKLYFSALNERNGLISLFTDILSGTTFRLDPQGPTELGGDLKRVVLDFHSHPSGLYAVSHIQGLFQLDGDMWTDISHGLPDMGFNNLVVHSNGTLYAAGGCDLDIDLTPRVNDTNAVHQIYASTDPAAGWTPVLTGDPFSSGVKRLLLHPDHPDVWYAATSAGLYVSTDAGLPGTWSAQNRGLDFTNIGAMAICGTHVYVGTLGGGVYNGRINPDFSVTWETSAGPYPEIHTIGLNIDPRDASVLYATAYPGGVFKSKDAGASWEECNFGLPSFVVADPTTQGYYSLDIDPGNPEVLYLGLFRKGIYKSTTGGATWRPLYGILGQNRHLMRAPITQVRVDPMDSQRVYAASQQGFYISQDAGETWLPLNNGLDTFDLRSLRVVPGGTGTFSEGFEEDITGTWQLDAGWTTAQDGDNHVLAGEGHHWARAGNPLWSDYTLQTRIRLLKGALHANVRVSEEGRYFLSLSQEGLCLKKQFDQWSTFADLVDDPGTIALGTWHDLTIEVRGRRIIIHLDGALRIDYTDPSPLLAGAIAFETLDNSLAYIDDVFVDTHKAVSAVYAGTAGYGIYALDTMSGTWRNLGRTLGVGWWQVWERRMYQFSSILFDRDVPGRIFLGHFPGGFFISENNGRNWRDSSLGLGNDGIFSLVMHPRDRSLLYAGTYNGVFRSTDGGHSWHDHSTGMPPEQWPYTIAIDDADPQIMYVATKNGQNKGFCDRNQFCGVVMKSTNGGASWTECATGLPGHSEYYRLLIYPENHDVLFLSTSNGVYWSRNAGITWFPLNEGLPITYNFVRDNVADNLTFTADGRHLLLGLSGYGLWRADLSVLPIAR